MSTDTNASRRFSKRAAIEKLDQMTAVIETSEHFDRSNGTAQLRRGTSNLGPEAQDALIRRAVEYGRWRAFEQFANMIEEGL